MTLEGGSAMVALTTVSIAVALSFVWTLRSTKKPEESPVMDLQAIQAPRLTGIPLQLFAFIIQLPILGKIIMTNIKNDNKFYHVKEFAMTLTHTMPLYYPLVVPTKMQREEHGKLASNFKIEEFANQPSGKGNRWTIRDYTSRYSARVSTPLEIITLVLDAIDSSNSRTPPFVAVIKSNRETILEEAKLSTERYARGAPLGVLDGVPIVVKDELDVVGYSTSYGTSFLGKDIATEDVGPVARLKAAGAIVVGKTNMHEVGVGTFGINLHHGTTRNPYNDQHMTGGSSSGSAAAVAARLVPLAVGCDGGGSIRVPSGLCGVVGIKATYMRIPFNFYGGPSVANVGPIAGTVHDTALAYAIMSGVDPNISMSQHQPPVFLPSRPLLQKSLRVGVFPAFVDGCDPEIFCAYQDTIKFLQTEGAKVIPVEIPHLQALHLSHSITILTELSTHLREHSLKGFTPDTQIALVLGQNNFDSTDFYSAQKVRAYATEIVTRLFDDIDVFLTPTTASLAPRLEPDIFTTGLSELSLTTALMRFIVLGNMVGIPGISVPVGYSEKKLPISMQLQAKHWNEHYLFEVASLLESHAPTSEPSISYSKLFPTK